ncbi:MAG: STAS domain-containing protein [Spirochaetaceae bacterium]|nr:STAS domain-containing protein [Spirochaetaceae bacterium]
MLKTKSTTTLYTQTITLEGRLDAESAHEFEALFHHLEPIIKEVILDLSKLTYISSMGLRAILQAYKSLNKFRKKLSITNIPMQIRAIFEISGFMQAFVSDEKLVIVEKEVDDLSLTLALSGAIDDETAVTLEKAVQNRLGHSRRRLRLLCGGLTAINTNGCKKIISFRDQMTERRGKLSLFDLSPEICESIKQQGCEEILGLISINHDIPSEKTQAGKNSSERYVFSGEWSNVELPVLDSAWKKSHGNISSITIDLTGVSGVSPEALNMLMELKKRGAEEAIAVSFSL